MRQGPLFIETSYPLNTLTKNIIFCTLKKYFTFSSIMNNCTLTKAFINILTKLYSLISQQNMLVTFCQALQLNNGLSMNFLACQFFRLATYMSDHPIELYSYPFDKHTCEVSFIFGKFYLHK